MGLKPIYAFICNAALKGRSSTVVRTRNQGRWREQRTRDLSKIKKTPPSPSSQHADQRYQDYRSHDGDQDVGNDAAAAVNAKQTEQVASNNGAGNAQQNVGEHAVA